ncbi:hypothetical protein NIES4072_05500 [Nostoc commune NIES-4072]|uniref:Uncharacterized protein n=2 Tax=Nostoc commune TaxID=1178 RepID=A0A2R5FMR2_NOSCO|nr:hypothetical protein NIES4070_21320 [Nostoc commune HK-02]GBG16904.1 hypothetical protein NIES4072_05500 [Nostoc commune NIES-4072]
MYADTLNAISTLRGAEEELFITSQNLIEFWRSATRPAQRNGLGLTIAEARTELERLEGLFLVLRTYAKIAKKLNFSNRQDAKSAENS